MRETLEYIQMLDRVAGVIDKLPARAATEAVNFSKERFRAQNWVDNGTGPWPKRKPVKSESRKRSGRATLVDTGRLRRSIRKVSVTRERAVIGTDVPYAQAHNDGFRGRATQNVRAHTRKNREEARSRDASGRYKKKSSAGGSIQVKAHTRTQNMNLPRRRFIGSSSVLDRRITRMMTAELMRAIKQ
ncbi:MAG: phage virion morphogenesis protein [Marinilabiliaceae bacterium]|nr:phage virion morphogenesis protein [Marinilabiliaceae bacterium]